MKKKIIILLVMVSYIYGSSKNSVLKMDFWLNLALSKPEIYDEMVMERIKDRRLYKGVRERKYLNLLIGYEKGYSKEVENLILSYGGSIGTRLDGIMTARIPYWAIRDIAKNEYIEQIHLGNIGKPSMDSVVILTNVNMVWKGEGLEHGYSGNGVIIGVIDGVFDIHHPAFIRDDSTSRILYF